MADNNDSKLAPRRLKAVVFDWAGTTVDCGCRGPVQAFAESFAAHGVRATIEEARSPMGMGKREHVAAMFAMPGIAAQWKELHGRAYDEADLDRIYDHVERNMLEVITHYSKPIPGVLEGVAAMRALGLRIGSCTGYPRPVAEKLAAAAALAGYVPECLVSASDVQKSRPAPDMCLEVLRHFDVADPKTAVKIGDTEQDILEGKHAGMWTIGITLTGSLVGLPEGELAVLSSPQRVQMEQAAGEKLLAAGADFLAPDIPSCLPILGFIEEELSARPQ